MAAGDGINPAQYSDSVIDWLRDNLPDLVPPTWVVFDPFAGQGTKLGNLCDELGLYFAGRDLEEWEGRDPRVKTADSTLARNYTSEPHIIVTSPTYNNGVNDHFEPRDGTKRLTYRNSLGRSLHPHNTGRYSGRGSRRAENEYWRLSEECVRHWGAVAIVNVKDSPRAGKMYPLGAKWMALLKKYGYKVTVDRVHVQGWRVGENHQARSEFEWILIAVKE
jgi:hypothetical protein